MQPNRPPSTTASLRRTAIPGGRVVNLRSEMDSEDVQVLLSLALGNPSPTRMEEVTQIYRFLPEYYFCGYRMGGDVVGCLGLQLLTAKEGAVRHLVVLPAHRRKGIARAMVGHTLRRFQLERLMAECDADAVDFFRRCGAAVEPVAGGRFRCSWAVEKETI